MARGRGSRAFCFRLLGPSRCFALSSYTFAYVEKYNACIFHPAGRFILCSFPAYAHVTQASRLSLFTALEVDNVTFSSCVLHMKSV
ncbi:hypothetical protein OBBRIDRAFT_75464 [Obba rivulosa]|uniref:Uncharacterized protein n=1 Tax=Obba rivulosa TaxID=1052685 RepID=A0A8E2DRZ7_9APHY|nr:hypothetical protein OBBRIDRAFT_75464 [Obba rivulosa]